MNGKWKLWQVMVLAGLFMLLVGLGVVASGIVRDQAGENVYMRCCETCFVVYDGRYNDQQECLDVCRSERDSW